MAWDENRVVANGVKDPLYELGRKIAAKEFASGCREMDPWVAQNALAPSFAMGYVQAWQSLLEFASLGLMASEQVKA